MAYEKTTWEDGITPITAERLNKMERGIEEVHKATRPEGTYNSFELTLYNNRLESFDSTVRYFPYMRTAFYRIYGRTAAELSAGATYRLADIPEVYIPKAPYSGSIHCEKNAQILVTDGSIYLRPLETIPKNTKVYIEGFWFTGAINV